ncbi:ubiquitin carboxyl-terminal hydrolase 3 [Capsicum chacoense]
MLDICTFYSVPVYSTIDSECFFPKVQCAHQTTVESKLMQASENADTHFICFTCVDGQLYEHDGRRSGPISSLHLLLQVDCCRMLLKLYKRLCRKIQTPMNFNVIAISKRVQRHCHFKES